MENLIFMVTCLANQPFAYMSQYTKLSHFSYYSHERERERERERMLCVM